MRIILIYIIGLALCGRASSADWFDAVMEKEGVFTFSDGSSFYTFSKDENFKSGPKGLSGRTIEGKWSRNENGHFVISGNWSWINGFAPKNDTRTMTMDIREPMRYQADIRSGSRIYESYFLIEDLRKIEK